MPLHYSALINKKCLRLQHAKKVVSNIPGLVDFAIGLVIFVINLPARKCCFLGKFKSQRDCNHAILLIKKGFGASQNDLWASTC